MSPEDAYEATKDFARAFPRSMNGEFGRLIPIPGGTKLETKFKAEMPGRLFLESLLPLRISRQQFDVMLREVAATETSWAKARVRLLKMAREASAQAWRQQTQTPEAVVGGGTSQSADQGGASDACVWAGGAVPVRPGERLLAYAQRLLRDHRDKLNNRELADVEFFVDSIAARRSAKAATGASA